MPWRRPARGALGIRDEVGFFQGVRAALIKTTASSGKSAADRELAIQQIVSRAVVSTEIVDIMAAAGLDRPDISVLSDEPALRVIAHVLVEDIRRNMTVDWAHRESARADIRRRVKRILRKYGYPPDLQDAAVQNVLQQAEALSAELA